MYWKEGLLLSIFSLSGFWAINYDIDSVGTSYIDSNGITHHVISPTIAQEQIVFDDLSKILFLKYLDPWVVPFLVLLIGTAVSYILLPTQLYLPYTIQILSKFTNFVSTSVFSTNEIPSQKKHGSILFQKKHGSILFQKKTWFNTISKKTFFKI